MDCASCQQTSLTKDFSFFKTCFRWLPDFNGDIMSDYPFSQVDPTGKDNEAESSLNTETGTDKQVSETPRQEEHLQPADEASEDNTLVDPLPVEKKTPPPPPLGDTPPIIPPDLGTMDMPLPPRPAEKDPSSLEPNPHNLPLLRRPSSSSTPAVRDSQHPANTRQAIPTTEKNSKRNPVFWRMEEFE